MTRKALRAYTHAHGVDEAEAEASLRRMLADFLTTAKVRAWPHQPNACALRCQDLELVVTPDRFVHYASRRRDALTWADLRVENSSTRPTQSRDAAGADPAANVSRKRQAELAPVSFKDALHNNPALLLDLLEPTAIEFSMASVARVCAAFDLGDPITEDALDRTRALLANDLSEKPDVTSVFGRFTVHGKKATWIIMGDGQAVVAVSPKDRGPQGSGPKKRSRPYAGMTEDPELSGGPREPSGSPIAAPTGQIDDVDESSDAVSVGTPARPSAAEVIELMERLASLKERGLLTDEEFARAKSKVLSS